MLEVAILGNRPQFFVPVPNRYKKLIEDCWSGDPEKRPTFDQIVECLRNDFSFISEADVDKDEFWNYVEFVGDNVKNVAEKNSLHTNEERRINEKEEEDNVKSRSVSLVNEHSICSNIREIVDEYLSKSRTKELAYYLNENCDYGTTSLAFDECFNKFPKLYKKLCQEGVSLDNPVAHHKYSLSLIFSSNNNSESKKYDKFNEAKKHLEKATEK